MLSFIYIFGVFNVIHLFIASFMPLYIFGIFSQCRSGHPTFILLKTNYTVVSVLLVFILGMAIPKGNDRNVNNLKLGKNRKKKEKEETKTHWTHPCLGSQQRDYRRKAWATGTGGKVVEVVQGHRR